MVLRGLALAILLLLTSACDRPPDSYEECLRKIAFRSVQNRYSYIGALQYCRKKHPKEYMEYHLLVDPYVDPFADLVPKSKPNIFDQFDKKPSKKLTDDTGVFDKEIDPKKRDTKSFDIQGALAAGYSYKEIAEYLASLPDGGPRDLFLERGVRKPSSKEK